MICVHHTCQRWGMYPAVVQCAIKPRYFYSNSVTENKEVTRCDVRRSKLSTSVWPMGGADGGWLAMIGWNGRLRTVSRSGTVPMRMSMGSFSSVYSASTYNYRHIETQTDRQTGIETHTGTYRGIDRVHSISHNSSTNETLKLKLW